MFIAKDWELDQLINDTVELMSNMQSHAYSCMGKCDYSQPITCLVAHSNKHLDQEAGYSPQLCNWIPADQGDLVTK